MMVSGSSEASGVLEVRGAQGSWNLAPYVDYLEEPDKSSTLKDISSATLAEKFQSLNAPSVNFGLSQATYWFRFTIRNASPSSEAFYVEIDNPTFPMVEFYGSNLTKSESNQISATSLPFDRRSVPNRYPLFALTLEPQQESVVYLRVVGAGGFRFNMTLWQRETFGAFDAGRTSGLGLYFGVLLTMTIFNILLYVVFKDLSFLYLATTTSLFLAFGLSARGYLYQFFWPDFIEYTFFPTLLTIGLALGTFVLFARQYLGTSSYAPKMDKVLLGVIALDLGVPVTSFFDQFLANALSTTGAVMTFLATMLAAMVCLPKQRRAASIFLLAFLPMIASSVLFALLGLTLVPKNFLTEAGGLLTFPISLFLFSLAIWDHVRRLEEGHRNELEEKVKDRTRDLTLALENVQTLHGLIPICAHCKNVRDDHGYWRQIESYISSRSEADFSHGVCPGCMELHYGEILQKGEENQGLQ
jgi:two-component system, sensor histidine kinase LadS